MTEQVCAKRVLTRRQVLIGGLAGLGGVAAGGVYASQIEPFWPALERVPMGLPSLGPEFSGLRLVQISDLHISSIMPVDYLRRQIEFTTGLAPDIIVMTGDYVTRGDPSGIGDLTDLAGRLSARHGVYATLGNHDYNRFRPVSEPQHDGSRRSADRIADALAATGVRVLRNQSCTVKVGQSLLQIVGVDDFWGTNYDPAAGFAHVDPRLPCIALCHNPDAIDDLKSQPCDWVLSGHTHGGQVRLPLLGAPILPIKNRQYDAGLFEIGDKRLYVNRGLGYLQRIRFNCRPEITEFTLAKSGAGRV